MHLQIKYAKETNLFADILVNHRLTISKIYKKQDGVCIFSKTEFSYWNNGKVSLQSHSLKEANFYAFKNF